MMHILLRHWRGGGGTEWYRTGSERMTSVGVRALLRCRGWVALGPALKPIEGHGQYTSAVASVAMCLALKIPVSVSC